MQCVVLFVSVFFIHHVVCRPTIGETKQKLSLLAHLYKQEMKASVATETGEQLVDLMLDRFKGDATMFRWIQEIKEESEAGLYDDAIETLRQIFYTVIDSATDDDILEILKTNFKDSRSYQMVKLMMEVAEFKVD